MVGIIHDYQTQKKRGIKAYDDVVSYIDNNRGLKQQYRGYIDESVML